MKQNPRLFSSKMLLIDSIEALQYGRQDTVVFLGADSPQAGSLMGLHAASSPMKATMGPATKLPSLPTIISGTGL